MSGIREGARVELLTDGWAAGSKISRGTKGTVIASQGFMRQRFTVALDNGTVISDLLDADLGETDLGFFRLGGPRG